MNIITVITTLIAAIGPTAIAIINSFKQSEQNQQNNNYMLKLNSQNNTHQLQLQKLEHYYTEKTSAINNYLENLSLYINNPNDKNFEKYQLAMFKVCLYISKDLYNSVKFIHSCLKKSENMQETKHLIEEELIKKLNNEAQNYN